MSGHHLTVGYQRLWLNRVDTWLWMRDRTLGRLRPVNRAFGQRVGSPFLTLTALFVWGLYKNIMAGSCSLSWLFVLRIHPSEHSQHSLTHLAWLDHHLVRFESIQVHCFEWLHLEALGDCVSPWISLVTLGVHRLLDCLELWGSSSRGRCLSPAPIVVIVRGSWPFPDGVPKGTLVDCSWLVDPHLVLVVRNSIVG
jgi:hypothetical protein